MRVVLVLALALLLGSNAFAISLSDGYDCSGVKGSNTHQHITSGPCKVYSILITTTSANGFAQIIDSPGPTNYDTIKTSNSSYVSGKKVLADPRAALANQSFQVVFPEGVKCGGSLFLDCHDAMAEVYYRE